jgi:hypothetical protein
MTFNLPVFFLSLFLFSVSSKNAFSAPLNVECEGDPEAKNKVIYLHGLDTEPSGPGERWTRDHLARMAAELDLQIALPRSNELCPPEALARHSPDRPAFCWENPNYSELIQSVLRASETCFDTKEPFGIIGFSTGGHLINQWILHSDEFEIKPNWFISVAANRSYLIDQKIKTHIQSDRPKVGFIFEKKAPDTRKTLGHFLLENGAQTGLFEFEGGHYFPPELVKHVLTEQLK